MVTGVDLVREQIIAAMGMSPTFAKDDTYPRGWSIECRINAEDPGRDFAPSAGTPTVYEMPAGFGVRVESAIQPGDPIMANYDSLIAKLISWGRTRDEAIARMSRALADYRIEGIASTIPFHQKIMAHEAFRSGETSTVFLARYPEVLALHPSVAAGAAEQPEADSPLKMLVEVGGRRLDVSVSGLSGVTGLAAASDRNVSATRRRSRPGRTSERKPSGDDLVAPGQGTVLRVSVENGQRVSMGDPICVIEAMKMENEIVAQRDGVVTNLSVKAGESISAGALIATIED
jgi:acetyl-CoA/propionyl-CoA carboxylase biotin carboxyl carrier protein